jgi:hypothetical protein
MDLFALLSGTTTKPGAVAEVSALCRAIVQHPAGSQRAQFRN